MVDFVWVLAFFFNVYVFMFMSIFIESDLTFLSSRFIESKILFSEKTMINIFVLPSSYLKIYVDLNIDFN